MILWPRVYTPMAMHQLGKAPCHCEMTVGLSWLEDLVGHCPWLLLLPKYLCCPSLQNAICLWIFPVFYSPLPCKADSASTQKQFKFFWTWNTCDLCQVLLFVQKLGFSIPLSCHGVLRVPTTSSKSIGVAMGCHHLTWARDAWHGTNWVIPTVTRHTVLLKKNTGWGEHPQWPKPIKLYI